jgi:secreted trypsin-like serine protease
VISAAHCIDGQNPDGIEVLAGAHNIKENNETSQQRIKVKRLVKNPKYNS